MRQKSKHNTSVHIQIHENFDILEYTHNKAMIQYSSPHSCPQTGEEIGYSLDQSTVSQCDNVAASKHVLWAEDGSVDPQPLGQEPVRSLHLQCDII